MKMPEAKEDTNNIHQQSKATTNFTGKPTVSAGTLVQI